MRVCPLYTIWMISVTSLVPAQHHCMSVRFLNEEPVQVALSQTLVLEVQVNITPGEAVAIVAWEKHGKDSKERIAEFPEMRLNPRVTLDKQGALLRVTEMRKEDYGVYTVTVTDSKGAENFARMTVKETERPPEATISLLCDVHPALSQWDTPVFEWLVDGVAVSNNSSHLSADGRRLHLSTRAALNYTCIVSSSQGTSIVQHITSVNSGPCDPILCTGWIWAMVVLFSAVCL